MCLLTRTTTPADKITRNVLSTSDRRRRYIFSDVGGCVNNVRMNMKTQYCWPNKNIESYYIYIYTYVIFINVLMCFSFDCGWCEVIIWSVKNTHKKKVLGANNILAYVYVSDDFRLSEFGRFQLPLAVYSIGPTIVLSSRSGVSFQK